MNKATYLPVILLALSAALHAQGVGIDLPGGAIPFPVDQDLIASPDGSYVALTGSSEATDVVIVEVDRTGVANASPITVTFPGGNDPSSINPGLVASRSGRFLCVYGNDTIGDLVLVTRNGSGTWLAMNVDFPASGFAPVGSGRPVISEDEDFIVCRGSNAAGDLVIVPIDDAGGFPQPGTPFEVAFPGGNFVAAAAREPRVTKNGRAIVINGGANAGDIVVVDVDRPVSASNTTASNIDFPLGTFVPDPSVSPTPSPRSNYIVAHAGPSSTGDLVIVPLGADGSPQAPALVSWPGSNFTTSSMVPPVISEDGRLIAVNGSSVFGADLVLTPVDGAGMAGTPVAIGFPASNVVANTQLPPEISRDARLVLQRGDDDIGDLVAVEVMFTSPTSIQATSTNILYPGSNDVPSLQSRVVLARDRSYCATYGLGASGDIVITPFDGAAVARTPINVLFPQGNDVSDFDAAPVLSRDGTAVIAGGTLASGDAVFVGIGIDPITRQRRVDTVQNVAWPAGGANLPVLRQPVLAPSGTFLASLTSAASADVVVTRLTTPVPHVLVGPGETGALVRVVSPQEAGKFFIVLPTLSFDPGSTLASGAYVPLTNDALFNFALTPNPFFLGLLGQLDADGVGEAFVDFRGVSFPQDAVNFYMTFLVLDATAPDFVSTISQPAIF